MKLSKKLRHQIYLLAYDKYRNMSGNNLTGMCFVLLQAMRELDIWKYDPYENYEIFPEIFKHKPAVIQDSGHWFPRYDRDVRNQIFKQAILETTRKTRKTQC